MLSTPDHRKRPAVHPDLNVPVSRQTDASDVWSRGRRRDTVHQLHRYGLAETSGPGHGAVHATDGPPEVLGSALLSVRRKVNNVILLRIAGTKDQPRARLLSCWERKRKAGVEAGE